MPKYYRPSSLRKHCTRIVTLLYSTYTYDGNGMISILTRDMHTSLVGSGENIQSSEYVYDHMGRLLAGSIEFVGKVGNTYAVSTSYNKVGGLESKVSSPDASAQVFSGTSQEMTYDLTYQYSGTKPHQLSEVISSQGVSYAMSFSYNASGSISEITDLVGVDHSSYYWGQEQWLCGVENTQGIHHYVYDHAGERIMKSSITQTTVQLNDETINTVTTLEPYTLYVNPYYVVTSFSNADQRSKHYYMGTQRVATDIGVDYGMSPSPEQTERARGGNAATAGEATQGLETDQVPFQSLGYKQDLERVLLGLSGEIGVEDLSEALAPIESFYPELSAGVNSGEGIESEPPVYIGTRILYWYHPDYVSNVDMITDKSGEAYELFLYNAWGESLYHWSSSSTNSWSSPYRFNSKELDSETGMHYYGARYHHPKLSVWMSVDPLAMEGHNITMTPYHFSSNNPVMRIDPDGLTDWDYNKETGKLTVVDGTQDDGPDRIIRDKGKFLWLDLGEDVVELEGKIENMENDRGVDQDGSYNYQTYTFSNSGDADKAYGFMAGKTDVEINKWDFELGDGTKQTRFYTSGDEKYVRGGVMYLNNLKKGDSGLKLLQAMHNHGNPSNSPGMRGGTYGPSPGDQDVVRYLKDNVFINQKPETKFYIWRWGTKTPYNENGKIKK